MGLKFATARDTELSRVLAEADQAIDAAILSGQPFELSVAGLLEDPAVVRNAAAPAAPKPKKAPAKRPAPAKKPAVKKTAPKKTTPRSKSKRSS